MMNDVTERGYVLLHKEEELTEDEMKKYLDILDVLSEYRDREKKIAQAVDESEVPRD